MIYISAERAGAVRPFGGQEANLPGGGVRLVGRHHNACFGISPVDVHGRGSDIRLLIVEDDDAYANLLLIRLKYFSQMTFHYEVATSVFAALQKLSSEPFDLILLDLTLPDCRGADTFNRVLAVAQDTPIIVLTALDNEEVATQAVLAGAQDFLIKDEVNEQILIRSIRYALGRHRLLMEIREKARRLQEGEEKFKKLITRRTDGVVVVDFDSRVRFTNERAEELLGCSASDLLDKPFPVPLHPDKRQEVEFQNRKGSVRVLNLGVAESEWEDEPVYVVSLTDITLQKRMEAELEAMRLKELRIRETRSDITQDLMDEGVLIISERWTVTSANGAALGILGISQHQVLRLPPEDLIAAPAWRDFFVSLRQGGVGSKRERIKLFVSDCARYVDVHAETVSVSDGIVDGYVCLLNDVTEFLEAAEMKNDFLGFVSHELRSPLTIIKGYASVLLYRGIENLKDQAEEFVRGIDTEASRLSNLLGTLLDISRLEKGIPLEMHFQPVCLSEVIDDALTFVHKAYYSTQVFKILFDDPVDTIHADRDKVLQVLVNLLSNALKYSPSDECIEVHVLGGADADAGTVTVKVKDHGIGINEEARKNLFTPFFRASGAQRKKVPGTGLGLYLCKQIVDAHGGSLWVESESGCGCTVCFRLPVRQPEEAEKGECVLTA